MAISSSALRAQENAPQPAPPPPYLTIGAVDASPGASVMVPLYFSPDPKTPVASFTVAIEFVSNNLTFQEAAYGVAGPESLQLASSVTTAVADDKGVKRSQLRLTAKSADPGRGLPEGLLAYFIFNLSLDAKPFVIRLTPTVLAASDTQKPARAVSALSAQAGAVTVMSADMTPTMACFFFTH
ncbi:MAG TPA: hypothetical protein VNN17_04330 [Terriglobia bacterium]|nr:hypothetical protein [Terriglobia bacterium]